MRPVIYATPTTPAELGLATSSAAIGGGGGREETFSDISLAPSTMAMSSPFVSSHVDAPMQMSPLNPLEDLDAFGGSSSQGQGYDGGHSVGGGGGGAAFGGGGGNTATEMLINQASSITANFQQALPAVASTVFSHFSNYLKGGVQPQEAAAAPAQHYHQQGVGAGYDGGMSSPPQPQYVSPLDDIYHQQMSNPTESVNQMPLFISPQDAPSASPGVVQLPPAGGAQNTYRIGGQKKKTYAPPPIQGFTSQAPGSFTPGYDPTMPIQSGAPVMPPLPPMPGGESAQQYRPPSVPQEQFTESGAQVTPSPQPPALAVPSVPPPMFIPPMPEQPAFTANQPEVQPWFQSQMNQPPPEQEKGGKFSLTSFFTSNPILDRLQGKSPTQQETVAAAPQGQSGYGGVGMGPSMNNQPTQIQGTLQPINTQMFNTSPIPSGGVPSNPMAANESSNAVPMTFFTPPTSAMQPPAFDSSASAAAPVFSPPPMMATTAPPQLQEPPKAMGLGGSGISGGGYRLNKSRPAYANPNLIAQSNTTSGFTAPSAPDQMGQVPPPTQWFNPAAPDVVPGTAQWGAGPAQNQQTIAQEPIAQQPPPPQAIHTPDVSNQMVTPTTTTIIPNVSQQVPLFPAMPPQTTVFNPIVTEQQEATMINNSPDLIVPPTNVEMGEKVESPAPFDALQEGMADVVNLTPNSDALQAAAVEMISLIKATEAAPGIFNPVMHQNQQPMFFNPVTQHEMPVSSSTPDLIVPPPPPSAALSPPKVNHNFFNQEDKASSGSEVVNAAVAPVAPPPTAMFFENAFSQQSGPVSSPIQNNESHPALFQPVNFFNVFSNPPQPQQPPPVNETIPQSVPVIPSSPLQMAFEPSPLPPPTSKATLNLDSNANVTSSAMSSVENSSVDNYNKPGHDSLWSDDNANFIVAAAVQREVAPVGGPAAASDSFFEASTTAVRDEQSQCQEDFLSSFEKGGDDLHAKFFDSPPEVQPTDPIANPNFFKSFMKAKLNANSSRLGEDGNDQSMLVEPRSHDDSSISSFPSFDQSSVQLANVTDSGFQVSRGGEICRRY